MSWTNGFILFSATPFGNNFRSGISSNVIQDIQCVMGFTCQGRRHRTCCQTDVMWASRGLVGFSPFTTMGFHASCQHVFWPWHSSCKGLKEDHAAQSQQNNPRAFLQITGNSVSSVIKVLQGVLLFWTMIVVLILQSVTPLQPPSLEYQLAEVLVNLEKLIYPVNAWAPATVVCTSSALQLVTLIPVYNSRCKISLNQLSTKFPGHCETNFLEKKCCMQYAR